MTQQNWRTETDAVDYFGNQKKTLAVADRRPVIRKAGDIVGPGIAGEATRITDFNDILATFNGYYAADVGAASAPNNTDTFLGHVEMDPTFGGKQTFTSLQTGEDYTRVFTRSPADPDAISWGGWRCSDHVPPTAYRPQSGNFYATTCQSGITTLLTMPDMDSFGTPGTFDFNSTSVVINRPGVYSGWLRIGGAASVIIDNLTVFMPDGSSINTALTYKGTSLYPRLWVPLHFHSLMSQGYIQVNAVQTTGSNQDIFIFQFHLSRIGDVPN